MPASGKAKIELLLEMKNKLKTGMSKARTSLGNNVKGMKAKLADLKTNFISSFKQMSAQIPLFASAISLIKNPFVLITAGLLAVGAMMNKTAMQAAEFNSEFLNIRQLNLDKSSESLAAYQKQVKEVAFDVGLAGTETVQAFYDVQSGTGLFGDSVASIVEKVGKFSIATGAELPDSINQTVKAMKAMGIGVEGIDAMLESNAKTVQVGITTFKELAQVQTEYLGAAAGAGQTLDTANKVFAAFTSIAKDSTTAATMTKTAFLGLTQTSTIKGLKSIGVEIYDSVGNMRDLSTVLKETSQEFKGMSSKEIDETINKIGGPEGLRNLFVKLKTGADDFFDTLEAFDASKFNLSEALKNAQGDFTILRQQAKNRLGIVMSEIGEKILPLWVSALEKANNALSFVWDNLETIIFAVKSIGIGLGIAKAAMIVFNIVTMANPIGGIYAAIVLVIGAISVLITKTEGWTESWVALKEIISLTWSQMKLDWQFFSDTVSHGINVLLLKFKGFGQYIKELFGNIGDSIKLAFKGDFSGAKAALTRPIVTEASKEIDSLKEKYDEKKAEYLSQTLENANAIKDAFGNISIRLKSKEEAEAEGADTGFVTDEDGNLTEAPAGGEPFAGSSDGVTKVTGSAKQIKNITINIDSFNKGGINTANTSLQEMSAEDIEKWMSDMFIRVVNNVETSFS